MKRVAVVDYGLGNLRSVVKALETAAGSRPIAVERTSDPERVRQADRLVVPGQGGFRECAEGLARGGLGEAVLERMRAGTPYFGICLGLQILFESSEEAEGVPGFGWFKGGVAKLRGEGALKIPHMGWNQIELDAGGHPALEACGGSGAWLYFVHSYHALAAEPGVLLARSSYGPQRVTAAVGRDNVLATQFHPEKSQAAGIALLEAFLGS